MDKETRYTISGELRANDPTGTTPEDPEATEDDTKDKVDNKDGKKISGYAIVFKNLASLFQMVRVLSQRLLIPKLCKIRIYQTWLCSVIMIIASL